VILLGIGWTKELIQMADVAYRANLSAAAIPVDPLAAGRTVVIKGYDNNYAPNITSKEDKDKDMGIPQLFYGANILPTEQGFRSAAYQVSQEACPGTPYTSFAIRSATQSALLVHTEEGYLYKLVAGTPQFKLIDTKDGRVTYATVSGTTYLFFAGIGCFTYDFNTDTLVPVTLLGLDVAFILGITSTGGYMLAWSADAIAWSSLFNPVDFVPSLDTGAGGGSVEGARGAITYCVSNPLGIFVFTETNCVSATLSNNAAFPFNFKEIVGSSGITDLQAVGFEGNSGAAYAYTSNGFQEIKHNGAKTIWTDISDNADITPVWDENTIIGEGYGTARGIQSARIATIGSRYVCVSIQKGVGVTGFPVFRDIWVYDNSLLRWGRLVKEHVEVFENEDHELAILTSEGKIAVVKNTNAPEHDFDIESDVGCVVLGRFQYSRQRLTQLQQIELEQLYPVDIVDVLTGVKTEVRYPEVYVLTAVDGKNGSFAPTYRATQDRYLYHSTGVNHSVMVKGNFYLSCVVLTLNNHGGR
jgi:hypothetical protein